MSGSVEESNEAKTRRLYEEVWNQRRLDLIADWVTQDFVGHWSMAPEPVRGPDGFRALAEEMLRAIPDAHFTIEEAIASGDTVVSRVRMSGTHTGRLQGFAPTGQPIDVQYIAIEHYRDGKCVDEWVRSDDLGMSRQIGALPPAGSLGERVAQRLFAVRAARMRRRAKR
jgi:predicted ester cyclase